MLGRVELSMTEQGQRACLSWCARLQSMNLERILHAPDELSRSTARLIGRRLDVPTKALEDLVEVDVGLWAGLTQDELKKRYARAFRELCDAPLNVSPPGGENFSQAVERLTRCLRKQLRRTEAEAIAFVLRPLVLALARCILANHDPSAVWETTRRTNEPLILENLQVLALAGEPPAE